MKDPHQAMRNSCCMRKLMHTRKLVVSPFFDFGNEEGSTVSFGTKHEIHSYSYGKSLTAVRQEV
jgi:hypothetical protein